jgi:predicted AAA+ superfamily ATPase
MRRKIYEKLVEWKSRSQGKTALMIEGARRVGKSWIVQEFARREYADYLLIDFSLANETVRRIFMDDLMDLKVFFRKLFAMYSKSLPVRNSLVIFDEVQLFPRAREAVKHLVADGRYDYMETGSLLSIRENTEGILLPSEEERLTMHPMDFEEFLWCMDETALMDYIRSCHHDRSPLGQGLHRKAMDFLREYLVLGGMPQVLAKYKKTSDLRDAEIEKRTILRLYRDDVARHAGKYALKVASVFDDIPAQLKSHNRVFHLSSLGKNARMRDYGDAFFWLDDAKIVNLCYNATEPNLGLRLNRDKSVLKCYMGDTGLLLSLAFDENETAMQEINRRLLFGNLAVNQGMLFENLVVQMLVASGHKLYFFTQSNPATQKEKMEVDFLISKSSLSQERNILPLEVKSSRSYSTLSLERFQARYSQFVGQCHVIHPKDLRDDGKILRLPIYMVPLL